MCNSFKTRDQAFDSVNNNDHGQIPAESVRYSCIAVAYLDDYLDIFTDKNTSEDAERHIAMFVIASLGRATQEQSGSGPSTQKATIDKGELEVAPEVASIRNSIKEKLRN